MNVPTLILCYILFITCDAEPVCSIDKDKISIETTARTATISWKSSVGCDKANIERYEVIYTHAKYQACIDGRHNEAALKSKEAVVTKVKINELHPYSIYNVTIKTTAKDGSQVESTSTTLETKADEPDIQPRHSPLSEIDRHPTSINFVWLDPDETNCIYQNGRRDQYEIQLLGRDPWEEDKIKIANNQSFNQYFAQNLKPYTTYMLRVFNKNIGNLINLESPIEIEVKTKETQPLPPTNLTAKEVSEKSVHLSWNPSYPPTGLIEKYELSFGQKEDASSVSDSILWKSTVQVGIGHQGACIGEKKRRSTTLSNSFCYVVNGLDAGGHYAFRIKAWNKRVQEPSEWSSITYVQTKIPSDTTTPISQTPPIVPESTSQLTLGISNASIITILCLAAGIVLMGIIVTAMVYKLKIIRLKQQIQNEATWNQNRTISHSSSYLPGASTSTQMTESYITSLQTLNHSDIQNRRLPEPPPIRNRADSKALDPGYAEAYELTALPSYLELSPSRRTSATGPSKLESTRIQDEECITDIDGYVKPTFPIPDCTPIRPGERERHRNSSQTDSDYVSESQEVPSLISPESYATQDSLRNERNPPYIVTDSKMLSGQFDSERISPGRRSQNSINFDRFGVHSSYRSDVSSKRSSPSEPLISMSKSVDV